MSLTRNEWLEMWKAIKHIETEVRMEYHPNIGKQLELIKVKIQKVIGQME